MNVELRARAGWWYAVVKKQRGLGRAVVRRLGTRDHEEAKQLVKLSGIEQQALAARANAIGRDVWTRLLAGRKVRVRDAVDEYEAHCQLVGMRDGTMLDYMRVISRFLVHSQMANRSISEVEARHIAEFVNLPGRAALCTRNWMLTILKGFFKFCFERHWVVTNPTQDVAVRLEGLTQDQMITTPRVAFTEEEVARLLVAIPEADFWHGAVMLAHAYGLRLTSITKLEESNIVGLQLRVYATKNKRVVNEPLTPEVTAWLAVWKTVRPASDLSYIFPAQAATPTGQLSGQFARILERLTIVDRCFHSLRKTATARVWNAALSELGGRQAQLLAGLVAQHGYRRVQELLAHTPGSDVTADSYLPRT